MAEGMLSLSWNNHSSTFCHMLSALREVERYTDVTVACEGKFYPVHKLVLSTCSDYFLKMFECTPCKHPVIVLKDVQSKDMEALLSYMYAGIVSVAQSDLAQLIKAAELLQIKGLAVPDEPPVSNRRGRNTADDSDSPHPKRHKRQDQNLGEHQSGDLSSPRSPVYDDDLQEDKTDIPGESPTMTFKSYHGEELADRETSQSNSRKDHRTAHQTDNKVEDEASLHERHLSQVVTMVDDTLIKEEMVEEGNDSGMTDTVFDYSNLEADMGLDDHEAGENQSGLMVPGRYDHQRHDQSFLRQFHQSESSSDARPGPSLLHGWQNPGDIGESSGGQGYTQEAPLPGHMDSHSLYPLVQLNSEDQSCSARESAGTAKVPTSLRKLQQFPSQNRTANSNSPIVQNIEQLQEKPYSCTLCSFRTAYQSNLTAHQRTHTGERPFLCPYCPSQFARKSHLKQHLSTHTGEKPYACQYCSYRSSRMSYLKRHMETHTG
ncbi:zinc finger and BTB domain-containing protein 7C-like isoform X3 [Homarus americanus]|uniref:zinc finger and BTB domain-containing protein 7C-like isoform X3 n=1 Tax=Homarus americanus TaxID=6706 RepID=UPI001C46AC0B|nr:zinc finger and BTB domain-containing protein 7C-like isoform X3 [Homarus americanus]